MVQEFLTHQQYITYAKGERIKKPWPPTSSINWVHWIPYGNKIWSGLSYMAQKTGHQIHPNPMMCPHDARLRWRLDLTCGSHVKYDPWGFKYGSHPTKILKMLKSPKDSYSFLFNPIHQWQDPWPPLRSLALQTSESGLCGMVLIGDLDSMIPGPKTETLGGRQLLKKKHLWLIY